MTERFSVEQTVAALRQAEMDLPVADLIRKLRHLGAGPLALEEAACRLGEGAYACSATTAVWPSATSAAPITAKPSPPRHRTHHPQTDQTVLLGAAEWRSTRQCQFPAAAGLRPMPRSARISSANPCASSAGSRSFSAARSRP